MLFKSAIANIPLLALPNNVILILADFTLPFAIYYLQSRHALPAIDSPAPEPNCNL